MKKRKAQTFPHLILEIILVMMILVLLAVVYTGWSTPAADIRPETEQVQEQIPIPNGGGIPPGIVTKVNCEDLSETNEQSKCYLDQALSSSDYTLCEKVSNEFQQNSCYAIEKLVKQKNAELANSNIPPPEPTSTMPEPIEPFDDNTECGTLTSTASKDTCYMTRLINKNDFTVCQKIINENLKEACNELKVILEG